MAERVWMGLPHAGLVLRLVLMLLVGTVMSSTSCGMMCGPLGIMHGAGSVSGTMALVVGTIVVSSRIKGVTGCRSGLMLGLVVTSGVLAMVTLRGATSIGGGVHTLRDGTAGAGTLRDGAVGAGGCTVCDLVVPWRMVMSC